MVEPPPVAAALVVLLPCCAVAAVRAQLECKGVATQAVVHQGCACRHPLSQTDQHLQAQVAVRQATQSMVLTARLFVLRCLAWLAAFRPQPQAS